MRNFVVAAGLAVMALAPAGAMAQTVPALSGNWTGILVQTFTDGRTASFTAMIAFRPDGTAETAYPSDACGGVLEPVSPKGTPTFTEEVTYGTDICVGGTVTLTPTGDTLVFYWESPGNGTAEGTLRRTDKTIPPR